MRKPLRASSVAAPPAGPDPPAPSVRPAQTVCHSPLELQRSFTAWTRFFFFLQMWTSVWGTTAGTEEPARTRSTVSVDGQNLPPRLVLPPFSHCSHFSVDTSLRRPRRAECGISQHISIFHQTQHGFTEQQLFTAFLHDV